MTEPHASPRTFLVECYSPGVQRDDVEFAAARAVAVSTALQSEGCSVEYRGAIFVPGDEVVFHLFLSDCAGSVHEASVRSAMQFERVVESVTIDPVQG